MLRIVRRQAIIESLEDQLKKGAKSLVGNKGYRESISRLRKTMPASTQIKFRPKLGLMENGF